MIRRRTLTLILLALSFGLESASFAQGITKAQIQSLMPDKQALQGFVQLRPAGETYLPQTWSNTAQKWITPVSPPQVLPDDFTPDMNLKRSYGINGSGSRLIRQFYSLDGIYNLGIELLACDSGSTARNYVENFRHQSQAVMVLGGIQNPSPIGDESWVDASNNGTTQEAGLIIMRVGRLVATISGDVSNNGRKQGGNQRLPASAIKAVAYQILLRASQQPDLTGVTAQQAQVSVNGHALPKGALRVGKQVYKPTQAFADSFAPSVTKEQIKSLIPCEQDLQGFVQVAAGSDTPGAAVKPAQDNIVLTHDPAAASQDWPSTFSESVSIGVVKRLFRSENNNFNLEIEVTLSDSPEVAHEELATLHRTAAVWKPGGLTSSDVIGNESLTPLSNGIFKTLAFRYGRLLAVIEGSCSDGATSYHDFPSTAIEAIAYQILLRASQQPDLTGVSTEQAQVAVNGHALPKGALRVGKQVYVPVQAFANSFAKDITKEQLQALLPDENDLPGFFHVAPLGENPPISGVPSPPMATHDQFWPAPTEATGVGNGQAAADQTNTSLGGMRRVLYSADGMYFVEMRMEICNSEAGAQVQLQQFLHGSSAVFNEGTFSGSSVIGDESSFRSADIYGSCLIFRAGNIFVVVSGRQSAGATRNGGPSLIFPPEAVEAVAYQILLRASQQPELTGVSAQQSEVSVNGHALPKGALLVGKQVYVPVQAFAKAMGITSRWDTKTGALTLSGAGRKTVALTAGSVKVEGGGASLKVPVLKQAGQPIMTLDDLLTVTGGRVTGRSGNTVQVKA